MFYAVVTSPFDDGYIWHSPVGRFRPNAFGVHDMHGNVAEWCREPFVSGAASTQLTFRDRCVRGGSFFLRAVAAQSAHRDCAPPGTVSFDRGGRPDLEL